MTDSTVVRDQGSISCENTIFAGNATLSIFFAGNAIFKIVAFPAKKLLSAAGAGNCGQFPHEILPEL